MSHPHSLSLSLGLPGTNTNYLSSTAHYSSSNFSRTLHSYSTSSSSAASSSLSDIQNGGSPSSSISSSASSNEVWSGSNGLAGTHQQPSHGVPASDGSSPTTFPTFHPQASDRHISPPAKSGGSSSRVQGSSQVLLPGTGSPTSNPPTFNPPLSRGTAVPSRGLYNKPSSGMSTNAVMRVNGSDPVFPQITPGASAGLFRPGANQANAANGTITAPPVTTAPPPRSYLPDGRPVFGVNASLPSKWDSGVLDLRWGMGNCTMNPGPEGYNAKSCSCVNRIGDWYHDYATATLTSEECLHTYDPGVAIKAQSLGCSSVTHTQLAQSYNVPTDCCNKCVIRGHSVHLIYWPPESAQNKTSPKHANITAAPQENERYGVVSDGYTFISPSVYVIYSDIRATASCVAFTASSRQIGIAHNHVTRAYAPDALSTAKCGAQMPAAGLGWCIHPVGGLKAEHCFQAEDTGWAPINYADLYDPPPSSVMHSVKQKCFTNSIKEDFAAMLYQSPHLSFPADVTDIDPEWATYGGNTCTPIYLGVADPPRALGAASALGPGPEQPVTAAAAFGPQPTPAQPAGQIDPKPTPTSVADPPTDDASKELPSEKPSNAPEDPINNDPPKPADKPAAGVEYQETIKSDAISPEPVSNDPAKPAPIAENQGDNNPEAVPPAPVTNEPVKPAALTEDQGKDDPNAVSPAPVNNDVPVFTDGDAEVDPSNLSDQQMDKLNEALAPASKPQPQQDSPPKQDSAPPPGPQPQPNSLPPADSQPQPNSPLLQDSQPQSAPVTGDAAQQRPNSENQGQTSNGGGSPAVDSSGGDSISGGNAALSKPDPQTVPIVLTPQQPTENTKAPVQDQVPGQSQSQVQDQAQAQPQGQGQAQAQSQSQSQGQAQIQNQAQSQPQGQSQVSTEGQSQSQSQSQGQGQGQSQAQNEPGISPAGSVQQSVQEQAPSQVNSKSPAPISDITIPFVNSSPQIGGQTVQKQANGDVVVGSTTIPEGTQNTVDGHTIFNGPENVVVDGVNNALAPKPASVSAAVPDSIIPFVKDAPQIGGETVQKQANGNVVVGSTTIPEGEQAKVNGHTISNSPDEVIVDGSPHALGSVSAPVAATAPYNPVPFVSAPPQVGGQTIEKQANGNVVVGNTIIPEGSQKEVDGHTISNNVGNVVVDGTNHALGPVPAPAAATPPLLADNQIVQVDNGGLKVGGQTLVPGSQVRINGHVVDYAKPGQVIVDGTTNSLTPVSTANPLVIDSQTMNRASNGGLVIAGSTMTPGVQATVAGHTYSMAGDSSIIADGQTYALPPTQNAYLVQAVPTAGSSSNSPSPITLKNGLIITPQAIPNNAASNQIYNLPNGIPISAGGSAGIVSGTTYSALPSGAGFLVNGASTLPIPTATPVTNSILTIAGQTFTAAPTGITLPNGQTISPNGPPATISGTPISLGPSGTLLLGTNTLALPSPSIFTVGDKTFTAQATGFVIAPGTTLTPGGAGATISGTPVSLAPNSQLQIGSTTVRLGPQSVFTLDGGEVFTAQPTGFVVDGTTVLPGGAAATVDGEVVSLGTNGNLHVGSETVMLGPAPTGADGGAVNGAGPPFEGAACRSRAGGLGSLMALAVGVGVLGLVL
ncbi:MAG: hypothetical protein Q9164_003343 [Protoblastenia rupestris]